MLAPGNISPCHHSLHLFAKRRESQHAGIAQQLSDLALKGLTPAELTKKYLAIRRDYREMLLRAKRVSRGSAGILVDENRLAYASVLFTRICVTAKSVEILLPDCKPKEHWDFSAVASLTRNLAESYLWYFWLCEDDVHADVRQGRFILLYCHDNGSRGRLFPEASVEDGDNAVMTDLIERFNSNPYLMTFGEKARREALKGHKTPFIQDDVLDRMGTDKKLFRFYYRFLSEHTHTGPVSFFRLLEHDRGKGVETEQEKAYIILATEMALSILESAISGHLSLFPDAETRTPHFTDADMIRNVERNRGRMKNRS